MFLFAFRSPTFMSIAARDNLACIHTASDITCCGKPLAHLEEKLAPHH